MWREIAMAVMRNVLEGRTSSVAPHFASKRVRRGPVAQASACVVLIFARAEKRTD
jgi:hypothetical protein